LLHALYLAARVHSIAKATVWSMAKEAKLQQPNESKEKKRG
jgi:hypothetical protein